MHATFASFKTRCWQKVPCCSICLVCECKPGLIQDGVERCGAAIPRFGILKNLLSAPKMRLDGDNRDLPD